MLALLAAPVAATPFTYQTVNDGHSPGPFYWAPPSGNIGWYWTPSTNVSLDAIETVLTTGFNNINNNFTLTTALYSDRPTAGGSLLGSYTANASVLSGGYTTGSFSSPIDLIGGTAYFIAFSGWDQVLTGSGGGGVNWIDPANQAGAQNLGAGSGYTGVGFDTQMNASATPANIDSPILKFIAEAPQTSSTQVPEPITLSLFGAGLAGAAALRRRKKA